MNTDKKFFTWNKASLARILAANKNLREEEFLLPIHGEKVAQRPFMILGTTGVGPINEAAFKAEHDPPLLDPKKKAFTNIQSTPLYTGFPLKRKLIVHYADGTSLDTNTGGIVESFAFGGAAPEGVDFSTYRSGTPLLVNGIAPAETRWSLKRAAAASSTWGDMDLYFSEQPPGKTTRTCAKPGKAFCMAVSGDALLDKVTSTLTLPLQGPKCTTWATGVAAPKSQKLRLSDGDVDGDLLGIIDTLVRNVKASLGFLNTGTALCGEADWDPAAADGLSFDTLERCISSYLPPLFGIKARAHCRGESCAQSSDSWGMPERDPSRLQVFKKADFVPFVKQLQASMKAGKTAVARAKLTTVDNEISGVRAGQIIDWCLFYLSDSKPFRAQLPKETRDELAKADSLGCRSTNKVTAAVGEETKDEAKKGATEDKDNAPDCGEFKNFPHYKVMGNNGPGLNTLENVFWHGDQVVKGLTSLTPPQVRLLSALTTWAVQENKDMVEPLFAENM